MTDDEAQALAEVIESLPARPLTKDEIEELARLDAMRHKGCYEL